MNIPFFTQVHVLISLIAIAAGMGVLFGFLTRRKFPILNVTFLIMTALTSLTGFLFPFHGMTPGIIVGILSMVVLVIAAIARWGGHMAGIWRGTYVVTSGIALWFNVFVLFAQLFEKVPELHAIAPTQQSPAFGLTQGLILILFVAVTFRAVKRFQVE
jgi:hypothetical protein